MSPCSTNQDGNRRSESWTPWSLSWRRPGSSRVKVGRRTGHKPEGELTMTREQFINGTVARLIALRDITRESGMSTTRSQRTLLQQLPDDILPEVALLIQQKESERGVSK